MNDDDARRFRLLQLEEENERLRRIAEAAGIPALVRADRPDLNELAERHKLVLRTYPQLECPVEQFGRSLHAACYFRRQAKLNASYWPTKWLDGSVDWLKRQGYNPSISLRSVVAAAIASNVAHSMSDRFPDDLELGYALGGLSKPTNFWRAVLESGQVPRPTPLARPHQYTEKQTMIQPTKDTGGVRIR
jgi:hypothetical protein